MFSEKGHLVLCIPGDNFSGAYLEHWTSIILELSVQGYRLSFSRKYTPIVYTTRNNILGGFWQDGPNQKPFKGQLDYDYMIWIDDDNIVSTDQILRLLSYKKDICAGWYLTKSAKKAAVCEKEDWGYRAKHGRWPLMDGEDLRKRKGLFQAYFAGFGCLAVKKGVFEAIGYPWFEPIPRTEATKNGKVRTYMAEDESFFYKAGKAGFKTWVDPGVKVGHEKQFTI